MIPEFLKEIYLNYNVNTYSMKVWEDKPEFYIQYVNVNCTNAL